MASTLESLVTRDAPIPTWFEVGGRAARFAAPTSDDELRVCLSVDPALRVLGEGANLLVDDDGVDELVVRLNQGAFSRVERVDDRRVRVGAGVNLFRLINDTVAWGLGGLEVLAGVPASMGGAIVMNAGGTYGQIADVVERVTALDPRDGREVVLERRDIDFAYRHSGLNHLVVTSADLLLTPTPPAALAARKKEINDAKLKSQPMSASSAGCCFKNPTLTRDIDGIGAAGQRVSAGLIIDRAGLKGLTHRKAMVSERHANFLVVTDKRTGAARDVIELLDIVATRVRERFGVMLQREVVVWSKHA